MIRNIVLRIHLELEGEVPRGVDYLHHLDGVRVIIWSVKVFPGIVNHRHHLVTVIEVDIGGANSLCEVWRCRHKLACQHLQRYRVNQHQAPLANPMAG